MRRKFGSATGKQIISFMADKAASCIRFEGGLSTLNKWVQKHPHDDLMSGPHDDMEKENTRLRKEV